MTDAPVCRISRSQSPPSQMSPTLLPAIPLATDLPSLIRTINIQREIINNITTSLTINNTYNPAQPRDPPILPNKTYLMSAYPAWAQMNIVAVTGFVFHKPGDDKHSDQRAYIQRTNEVEFRNPNSDNDQSFYWRYTKNLDSQTGDSKGVEPFKEDFFERILNVTWQQGLAVDFGAHAENSVLRDETVAAAK